MKAPQLQDAAHALLADLHQCWKIGEDLTQSLLPDCMPGLTFRLILHILYMESRLKECVEIDFFFCLTE